MICKSCGEDKNHYGHGLCQKCYRAEYYAEHRDEIKQSRKEYCMANRDKINTSVRMYRYAHGSKPASENMTDYTGNFIVICEGRTEVMTDEELIVFMYCGDEMTIRLQKKDEVK